MGRAGDMARAQEAVQKAGTLAQAQSILDKMVAEEQEVADIFYTQEQMIGSLTDVLAAQDQPLYVSTPAPIQKPRNYLLLIVIGIGILIYLGKIKLGKIL